MTANRILPLLGLLAVCWALTSPARASGDFSCDTVWRLDQTVYADCNNFAFLSPGNDTRVNLELLLLDAGQAVLEAPPAADPPAPSITDRASPFTWEAFGDLIGPRPAAAPEEASSDYASGEGSRCRSNAAGAMAFSEAMRASAGLPADERAVLEVARAAISPACDDGAPLPGFSAPAGLRSPLGRQFAEYLAGAAAFYGGDFDSARKHFSALAGSAQPWLRETARYMQGRAALNEAQWGAFDEYGLLSRDKVDAAALAAARKGFDDYLKAYPNGGYAASARGLSRRIDWLAGQPGRLAADLDWSFAHAGAGDRNVSVADLVLEADNKLLTTTKPAEIADPRLLATADLMAMRSGTANSGEKRPTIAFADLMAQRPVFARDGDLFAYLLAAHRLYVEADPAGALDALGAAPSAGSAVKAGALTNLDFSREILRGEALEAKRDWAGARTVWLGLIGLARPAFQRPVLDLALASNLEHDGQLAEVFAKGSPIVDSQVREILIRRDAGPALLAERVQDRQAPGRERRVARYVLLYKDLTRGRYGEFARNATLTAPPAAAPADPDDPEPNAADFDWPGGNDDYTCESLRRIAAALAGDPHASHPLLCLGEFVRAHGMEDNALDARPVAAELGGAPSQFPGAVFSRLSAYQEVMVDPKAPVGDRAYALYRAINCYAPSGINECGGHDVAPAERARWFHQLKTVYRGSDWAAALKYYW